MKKSKLLTIAILLLIGLVVRLLLSMNNITGDINASAEWGMKFWQLGSKNFYSSDEWYYTFPTQPPLINLIFGFIYWLSEKNIFATLHNYLKILPSSLVTFFGTPVLDEPFRNTYGYYFLIKLLPIISDLGLSIILYKITREITKSYKKSLFVMSLYLFNPVTIFLSSIWGQIESLVAIPGILAFYYAYKNKIYLSFPILFICFYLKPTWALLLPFYLFVVFKSRPKIKDLVIGSLMAIILFVLFTYPFSGSNFIGFTKGIIIQNMLPNAKGTGKLSVSAFNFFSIFWQIDKSLTSIQSNAFSLIAFVFFNVVTIGSTIKTKLKLQNVLMGIFVISIGSFLFMDNMLERYFFPGFVPLCALLVISPRQTAKLIILSMVLFINLYYSFFRRSVDNIASLFAQNNFLLVRALSAINTITYCLVIMKAGEKSKGPGTL